MDNDNTEIMQLLQNLDVNPNEAATYAALLRIESVSIRKIAAYTGINRGTTYEALKRLMTLGLVSVRRQGQREQYVVESPEKIYDIIRNKRRDLLDAATHAKKIIPKLLAQKVHSGDRPLVRYYEDDEGIAVILRDVLTTCSLLDKPEYYAYSSMPVRQFLYRTFPQFTERRISADIHVRVIAVGEGGDSAEKSERKWLPHPPAGGVSSYMLIYGDKQAVISITESGTPYGVVIEDRGATAMQRLLFEQLWNTL